MPYNQISWRQEKFLNVVDLIFFLIFRSWLIKDAWHQCGVYCNTKSGGKTLYAYVISDSTPVSTPLLLHNGIFSTINSRQERQPSQYKPCPSKFLLLDSGWQRTTWAFWAGHCCFSWKCAEWRRKCHYFYVQWGKMCKSQNLQQFFNSPEDKIDLYKLCCNLFAAKAKFHLKSSSQKLFVDLNSSKGSIIISIITVWGARVGTFAGSSSVERRLRVKLVGG